MVPSHRLTDDGDQGTPSSVHTLSHLMVIIHEDCEALQDQASIPCWILIDNDRVMVMNDPLS